MLREISQRAVWERIASVLVQAFWSCFSFELVEPVKKFFSAVSSAFRSLAQLGKTTDRRAFATFRVDGCEPSPCAWLRDPLLLVHESLWSLFLSLQLFGALNVSCSLDRSRDSNRSNVCGRFSSADVTPVSFLLTSHVLT